MNEQSSFKRWAINKPVISQEVILEASRDIVAKNGPSGLTMRDVAQACGIALGSLYNYFPSKSDLLIATIESVWEEIFSNDLVKQSGSFVDFVDQWYDRARLGTKKYPNFFNLHSFSFASAQKPKARQTMLDYFERVKQNLKQALTQDEAVAKTTFHKKFSADQFLDFVLNNLLHHLMQQQPNCHTLQEIIRRTIY